MTSTGGTTLEALLAQRAEGGEAAANERLARVRTAVLLDGVPRVRSRNHADRIRPQLWKVLLRVKKCDATRYASLVRKAESPHYPQIRRDTSRTFKDAGQLIVPEEKMSRVLNAFFHSLPASSPIIYLQGMSAVCAVFLFVMPELDAFYCFERLIKHHLAPYCTKTSVSGTILVGCQLVLSVLRDADFELHQVLDKSKLLTQFPMAPVMTLNASSKPLSDVVVIWDFLLAGGVHLNIYIIAAQLMLQRSTILSCHDLVGLLGKDLPELAQGEAICSLASHLFVHSKKKLADKIQKHLHVATS